MDANPNSLSICQRLINFIFSILNRSNENSSVIPNDNKCHSFSEIVIEFNHAEGSENWTRVNDGFIRARKKDAQITADDQTMTRNGLEASKGKRQVRFNMKTDHEPVETRSGTDRKEKKEVGRVADQATMVDNQRHEEMRQPRRPGLLLSAASNINEKSDAYIERMKKAMRRNSTLGDPGKL